MGSVRKIRPPKVHGVALRRSSCDDSILQQETGPSRRTASHFLNPRGGGGLRWQPFAACRHERSRRSERWHNSNAAGAAFASPRVSGTENGGTVLNLIIGLFRGFVFPYISRIHTALGIKFQGLLHVTLNITRVHVDYHHFQPLLG